MRLISFVLVVELIVKCLQLVQGLCHPLRRSHQVSYSEMVLTFFLAEPGSGHGHDASLIHKVQTVEEVRLDAHVLGCLDGALGQVNPRERVHGALNLRASSVTHLVESLGEQFSTLTESVEDVTSLFLIEIHSCV